jgi:uncharacterized protein (TIRG00374 family)
MTFAKLFKKFSFLIGLVLFVYILSRLDFAYYKNLINSFHLVGLLIIIAAIVFLFLPSLFLKTYRWQYLMKRQEIHHSFWQTFLMYQASVYLGMFTPARVGEASRVLYLKKDHSLGKAFVSIVLDRLADMVFLLAFGYFGMFLFLNILKKEIWIFSIIILALLLMIFLIWKSSLLKYFFQKIFYYFVPQKYHESWKLNFQDFFQDLKIYKFFDYSFVIFLTLANWFLFYLIVYIFALEIGLNIPFFYFSSAIAIASLITFLPISVAGIGTRDITLLAMFSLFRAPIELTIAVSMFILFLTFFVSAIGLFSWLKKPFEL